MHQSAIIDFLRHLECERGLSTHTVAAYRSDIQHFVSFMKGREIVAATQEDCISFLGHLQNQGYANASIGRVLAALKTFFRFLVREELIKESPTQLLESPKQWEKVPTVLSENQVERLLEAADTSQYQGALDLAIMEMLYSTGLRVSELCRLTLDCVDDRRVKVFGKGGKERLVPVGSRAIQALDHYLAHFRNDSPQLEVDQWLFLTPQGRSISRLYVWQRIKYYATKVGLSADVSPHTLRHTYATHLLERGASVRVIQDLLGHAHIDSTDRYTQMSTAKLHEAFDNHHPRKI